LTNRVRVAYVIQALHAGGAERRLLATIAGLDRDRFEPLLVCIDEAGALEHEARALGLRLIVVGRPRRRDPAGILRLARLVRTQRIDVVHGWLYLANVYARLGGRLGGAPVVVASEGGTIVSTNARRARAVARTERALAGLTDAVVANSRSVAAMLEAAGVAKSKVVVIHNGVAILPELSPDEWARLRASTGTSDREHLIGMVARLDAGFKDHATLLRAFAAIASTHPDVRLAIVGDGPARAQLEQLAQELGLAPRVTFTGHHDDARRLVGALDVSVLLSHSEGFSNVVLESLAAGVPLVASDIPPNREALTDGREALLVPVGDVRATADAVARLLDDPELAAALGRRGRERAEAFSLEAQATQVMRLYERLLERKQPRRSSTSG
jgi:glycosyltransferase involved in cell wall biosynthesis